MLKKLSMIAVSGAMAVGLTACNDRDVAIGAAAVGTAIVASSVYDNNYGRDYRSSRGYYRNGGSYYDRYDGRYYRQDNRWYRDGRGWDRGGGRGWNRGGGRVFWHTDAAPEMNNNEAQVQLASLDGNFDASVNKDAAVAAKYRISSGAARNVISAFENIKRYGKMDSLSSIGMLPADIDRMAQGRAPSSASVASIARTLGARTASVQALMLDVNDEISIRAQGTIETK